MGLFFFIFIFTFITFIFACEESMQGKHGSMGVYGLWVLPIPGVYGSMKIHESLWESMEI